MFYRTGFNGFGITAVSYTHLDVYKRQAADVPGEGVAGGNLKGGASTAVSAELDHRMSAFGMVRSV